MTSNKDEAEKLYKQLKEEAESAGYLLNPDKEFVMDLMDGLVTNRDRYGYLACPCRLADGERSKDLDIICPCDYRDPDLDEFGACYCALYVSEAVAQGKQKTGPIPERRGEEQNQKFGAGSRTLSGSSTIWRCNVCGYLCANERPPLKCPICRADQDRFESFQEQTQTVWKCNVCGYLCARPEAPLKCPICKADKDRFDLL